MLRISAEMLRMVYNGSMRVMEVIEIAHPEIKWRRPTCARRWS